MKDFYSIKDFYNQLRKPDRVPTAHRHFQVYLYPIVSFTDGNGSLQVVDILPNNLGLRRSKVTSGTKTWNSNHFFDDWLEDGDPLEQFSLAIQDVTIPIRYNVKSTQFESPFGIYHGVDNDDFYGKMEEDSLTFTLIDQVKPFFEKKINEWIFEITRCGDSERAGTPIPRVNIAIKYFRQDDISKKTQGIIPNFIYYFTDAYPYEFQTCSISHANDSDADFKRQIIFKFNNMYVLHNQKFAEKFGLKDLFGPINII